MIYNLQYDGEDIAKVEITESILSRSAIIEMVQFWSGWKSDLAECKGDYVECWLRKLALYIVRHQKEPKDEEGWYPLDGSHHIWVRDVWGWEPNENLVEIEREIT